MGPMKAAIESAEQAFSFYARDMEALSEAQILDSAGGVARKPVDFTYEVALINRRVAARLRGEEPAPWPGGEGFLCAPSEYLTKVAICEFMNSACAELLGAAKAIPEAEGDRLVGPPGKEEPAYGMVNFASMHTMYHDAQLNFIQSLAGDGAMHWF